MQCRVCFQDNPQEAHFCSKCGAALFDTVEPLHVIEIGVASSYGNGWQQLWKNFLMLFLIGIIVALISSPSTIIGIAQSVAQKNGGSVPPVLRILSWAYGILITGPLGYGVSFAFLKAARNDPLDIKDMFESIKNYWNAVLASLLVMVIVGFGFVCLIVPGIIFACKLAFTPYLVVDQKMNVIDAVKESWYMTRGHAWDVFLVGLLAIPICILGLMCCLVGLIPAGMWVSLAFASLYHAISTAGMAPVYYEEHVV